MKSNVDLMHLVYMFGDVVGNSLQEKQDKVAPKISSSNGIT